MALKNMTGQVEAAGPYISRWQERDDRRRANAELAKAAAENRMLRNSGVSIKDRVEKARTRIDNANVAGAIQLIQTASPKDYDYFILAEKYGQARRGVMKQFGAPRGSVERQYLSEVGEVGVGDPEGDPVDGSEE